MKELDECLELKREINRINDKIKEIEAITKAPKNQIITGMPRSNNVDNVMDRYLIKIEGLEEKRKALQNLLDDKWDSIFPILAKCNLNAETIELLRLRFYKGLPWKICVSRLQKKHPKDRWNNNKAFRLYGKAMILLRKI